MALKTTPWSIDDYLTSRESILAYLEAVFEDGDPALIAAALNDVARASGLPEDTLTQDTGLSAVIHTLKSMGFELTARAA